MYVYLDFITEFSCQMCGRCCRNDWLVTVDKAGYYRNEELFSHSGRNEEFAEAFRLIDKPDNPGEYAYIAKKPESGCWFLESDNRCRLHREAGHDHLDSVCQTYPRYPMGTARGIELTLSFSCPAVLALASVQPSTVIRSEVPPMSYKPENFVVEVHPSQRPTGDLLCYYFELEQHFIDILQWRGCSLTERLKILDKTLNRLGDFCREESLGDQLNKLTNENYDLLDATGISRNVVNLPADILTENFLVNFVFKKSFYTLGLTKAAKLINNFWQIIQAARIGGQSPVEELERVSVAVAELEFQYCHSRQTLLRHLE